MRAISAADAVSPAIQRTRDFLFRPFRWGTYLKLCLVAMITEGFGSNFDSSHSGSRSSGHVPMISSPFGLQVVQVAALIAASLLVILISFAIFYLITRLRFAYFHCLVHNTTEIRPGWSIYRGQASRFFWLNIAVGLCFLLVVALIAIPFCLGFWRVFHQIPQGSHPNFGALLPLILPLIPIFLLPVLFAVLADIVLRDFMMPHFALENASAGAAWAGARARMMAEKRQFLAYVLLRLVLPLIAMIGLFFALMIPGLILAGSLAMLELGLHAAFANSTGGPAVVGILVQVFFGVLAFGFLVLAGICLGGPVSTGVRQYALLFYGGRYNLLGDLLEPPGAPISAPGAPHLA